MKISSIRTIGTSTHLAASLVTVLDSLEEAVGQDDLGIAVGRVMTLHPDARGPAGELLTHYRAWLGNEQESDTCPGWSFQGRLAPLFGERGAADIPLRAARVYLQSTAYLVPILTAFGRDLQGLGRHGPLDLFLRDALVVWPILRALAPQ